MSMAIEPILFSSRQCPITSEHPTKGHTLKLMESHIPCTSIVLRSSIDEAEKERLRLRHSEIHKGSSNQNILSGKHRQLQAGNVNNNWPWIRVTLHLNGLIVCMYMSDWELPLRQNDLRSRLRPRCNRFHLTLTSSSPEVHRALKTFPELRSVLGAPWTRHIAISEIYPQQFLIWIRVAGEIKAMSEDVVPHLACEASAANAAICSQTLSFRNVLRWMDLLKFWFGASPKKLWTNLPPPAPLHLRLRPLSNEIWK